MTLIEATFVIMIMMLITGGSLIFFSSSKDHILKDGVKKEPLDHKTELKKDINVSNKDNSLITTKVETIQNHYHFEKLNSGLEIIGSSLLFFIALFFFLKISKKALNKISVLSALKKSKKLIFEFNKNCDIDKYNQLVDMGYRIEEQICENNLLIELNKESHKISKLIHNNNNLKEKSFFIESTLSKKRNISGVI